MQFIVSKNPNTPGSVPAGADISAAVSSMPLHPSEYQVAKSVGDTSTYRPLSFEESRNWYFTQVAMTIAKKRAKVFPGENVAQLWVWNQKHRVALDINSGNSKADDYGFIKDEARTRGITQDQLVGTWLTLGHESTQKLLSLEADYHVTKSQMIAATSFNEADRILANFQE